MLFKIQVPIFATTITVSDNPDSVFYTEHDRELARGAYGQTGWYDGRGVSMYIEPNSPADTLVHECVHAAGVILKMRGIGYGAPPDDEALAYLTGWIYAKINNKIKEQNNDRRNKNESVSS